MSFLVQVARLFSTWPGDWVYHLTVLFAIEASIGLAVTQGRHLARRVLLVGLALTCGRVALIMAAWIARQAGAPAAAVLPPLERFVDITSLGLLAWAFVPLWSRSRWAGYGLYLANPLVALVVYIVLALNWYGIAAQGAVFNGSWQDSLWCVWGLALGGAAIIGLVLPSLTSGLQDTPNEAWGQALAAFVFILAGYLLQLLFPDPALFTPGWTRLAFFVAYPLFVVTLYQQVVRQAVPLAPRPPAGAFEAFPSTPPAWLVWDALRQVAESAGRTDQTSALEKAAAAIADATGTQVVALGIPSASLDAVELVAVHGSPEAREAARIFQLDTQPVIKRAIAHKQGASIEPRSSEALAMAALLNVSSFALLWVEPILHERQALGILIAGRTGEAAKGGRPIDWSPAEIQNIRAYTLYLGGALSMAQRLDEAIQRAKELSNQLSRLEREQSQAKANAKSLTAALQAELDKSKAGLYAAQQQVAHYRKQVEDLVAFVQLQERSGQQSMGQTPAQPLSLPGQPKTVKENPHEP